MERLKEVTLSDSEIRTAMFYLEKSLIDAEGMKAVGVGSRKTVTNLKSIIRKLEELNP